MTQTHDPQGKRALFETPVVVLDDTLRDDVLITIDDRDGRDALFSVGPHQAGTGVVECTHCATKTRISHLEIAVRIAMISLWVPGKYHSRWMQCPACQRRSWCRVDWLG
jgi:hypothetical protein